MNPTPEITLYKQWLIYVSPIIITLIAGAFSVLGFAPFDYYLIPLASLMWLFWLWRRATPATAFRYGWLFGFSFMGFGVFWLRISIGQFGGVDSLMAVIATLGFVAVAAVYFGLAGWLGCIITPKIPLRLILTLPSAWGIMEWLKGWLFTGFPWMSLGYSQLDTPLRGYAPLLGIYGVSWILVLSVGLLLFSVDYWYNHNKQRVIWATMVTVIFIWLAGERLAWQNWTDAKGEPFMVSLVQPSIPQSMKWDPDLLVPTLKTYRRLTETTTGKLVVWPETAVPDFLHRVEQPWLLPLAHELKKRNAHLLVGTPVLDKNHKNYYNGAALVGVAGAIYHKRHLVPFGEYLPFRPWLGPILKFLTIPMSNFTPGTTESLTITIGQHIAGLSICYEDAFGEEIRDALPTAEYLINLSNDAWFGNSLAPHQHLQIARMRALETGRTLVRATNSGISAIIDHHGRVRAASKLFTETVLTAPVQPRTGSTYFVYWGNKAALLLMSLCLMAGLSLRFLSISYNQSPA